MACCTNTLDLGCINHCNQLSFGTADIPGSYNGIFTSGNITVTQQVTVLEGDPFIFDMTLLNEQMSYTLVIYNSDNEQVTLTIDEVEYDCFTFKTVLDGVIVPFVPVTGCTPMCKEIYDPNDESTPVVFNIIAGPNITVDITDPSNPIVSASGGGGGGAVDSVNGQTGVVVLDADDIDDSTTANKFVTSTDLTTLSNTSGTNTGDNAANSQYSGLASSKQDTLVSGTNIKTVNSNSLLGSGDIAVQATLVSQTNIKSLSLNGGTQYSLLGSGNLDFTVSGGSSSLSGLTAATATNIINNGAFGQEWQWNSLVNGNAFTLSSSATPDASFSQSIFQINGTGTNNYSSKAFVVNMAKTGTGTNIGLRLKCSGATNNIALSTGSGTLSVFGAVNDNSAFNSTTPLQVIEKDAQNYSINSLGRIQIRENTINGALFTNGVLSAIGSDANGFHLYTGNLDSASAFRIGNTGAVTIGKSGATAVSSSILELTSTTRGFLPPRMTTTQKNAISSPATGLVIYDTTLNKLCVFTTAWETITSV